MKCAPPGNRTPYCPSVWTFPDKCMSPMQWITVLRFSLFYANGHCQCKGDMYIKVQSHHPHDTQSDMNRCPCKQIIPPAYWTHWAGIIGRKSDIAYVWCFIGNYVSFHSPRLFPVWVMDCSLAIHIEDAVLTTITWSDYIVQQVK